MHARACRGVAAGQNPYAWAPGISTPAAAVAAAPAHLAVVDQGANEVRHRHVTVIIVRFDELHCHLALSLLRY